METAWIQATAAFGIYPSNTSVTNSNQYTKGGRRHLAHDALASLVVQAKKKGGRRGEQRLTPKQQTREIETKHVVTWRIISFVVLVEVISHRNTDWGQQYMACHKPLSFKSLSQRKRVGAYPGVQDPKFKHINAFLFLPVFSTLQSTILAARSATQCAHVRWCLRRMQPPSSTRRAAVSCPALSLQISKSRLSHNGCRFCFLLCFGAPFGT